MREAKMRTDLGGAGALIAIAILAYAFFVRDKVKNTNAPPVNGNNGNAAPLEIRGLTVQTAAQSPLMVTRVTFEHRGPASDLAFGIAGKPDGAIWGVDFNNGDNVVPDCWFLHYVSVPEAANWTTFAVGVDRELREPEAGLYTTRGGNTKEFIAGMADVWVWITNRSALRAAGLDASSLDNLMDERFIVVLDTDADVLPVGSAVPALLEVQKLTVNYL